MSQPTDTTDDFTYVIAGTPEAAIAGWSAATHALVDEYQAASTRDSSKDGAR